MTVGPVDRDDATAEFFDAAAAGRLLLRRCEHGHYSEPAVGQCTTCGSLQLEWAPAAGGASLVSWAVSRLKEEPPTVLVIAELDEGPWWWSQLTGADPATLRVGARLAVAFAWPDHEHEVVPVFELASRPELAG
jgi:uncharacterized protein